MHENALILRHLKIAIFSMDLWTATNMGEGTDGMAGRGIMYSESFTDQVTVHIWQKVHLRLED